MCRRWPSGSCRMELPAAFERLRRAGRKALIPFIMGGDPDLRVTGPLLLAVQEAGADIIEVGIPFSDPLADGSVIQAASARALARGATPPRVLAAVASVRARLRVPVVALTYWNPVLQFGNGGAVASVQYLVDGYDVHRWGVRGIANAMGDEIRPSADFSRSTLYLELIEADDFQESHHPVLASECRVALSRPLQPLLE